MSTGWIVLGVIVILVLFAFGAYNRLVALRQRVDQSFADIDVQLKQRHDLIPNLVETVKGYASPRARHARRRHQGAQFGDVGAGTGAGLRRREPALRRARPPDRAVGGLSGPQGQRQLPAAAGELSDLENKIAASRRFFNNAVQEYNTGIQQMPAALFAGMFGFTRKEFFDLGASRTEVEAVPTVKF